MQCSSYTDTGARYAYVTLGLPQLMENNPTGILIDLHQLSWIGDT